MDTRRSTIRQVFEGRALEVPPVSVRLDIWHTHAVNTGTLPAELAGLTAEGVEDYLGFCRSARYRTQIHLDLPGRASERCDGDRKTIIWQLPGRVLEKSIRHTHEERLAGMSGQIVKYPVSTEAECRALTAALDHAALEADFDGFDEFDAETGDAGLPMLILGPCPTDYVMLELMGYESFFYALADYPDALDRLIGRLEELFRAEIWPRAFASSSELILHGAHFSDATTPPSIFRKYILPYFREFNAAAHDAGKRVLWHADAGMGLLLNDVLEAGFDGADCLATAPLVPQTFEDYYDVWKDRIVCWGGLPGIIFNPEFAEQDFTAYLSYLRDFTNGKPGIIIGASDNVMPGALWERVLVVRDAFPQ
jgi:hypothetical protein